VRAESITIAIPAYNEIDTLERAVLEALSVLPRHTRDYEVLVVDDGSTDGTAALADRLAAAHPEVTVVHHARNHGFSGAMRTCLWKARGQFIMLAPADGQARLSDIEAFLDRIDGYDLLFGRRVIRDDSSYRKWGSRMWYAYIRFLFSVTLPEFSALFLFRREAIQSMRVDVRDRGANMLPALFILATAQGFRVGTVDCAVHARAAGQAKGGRIFHTLVTMAEDLLLWWRWRAR
jgi:glycosyltransferase involved in cell wall biosynthesis